MWYEYVPQQSTVGTEEAELMCIKLLKVGPHLFTYLPSFEAFCLPNNFGSLLFKKKQIYKNMSIFIHCLKLDFYHGFGHKSDLSAELFVCQFISCL